MNKTLIVLISFLFAGALAHADTVSVLNQTLKKEHAGWVAKKTPLTGLTPAQARAHMGLAESHQGVEFQLPVTHVKSQLPAVLDWRNKDGQNWVTPILDQGNCGSCVAFASIGTLETQYRIASGIPGYNVRLSAESLFACGGGGCNFGWFPSAAAEYLQRTGVPDEACQPYTEGVTGEDAQCKESCLNSPQKIIKIASYGTPTRYAKDIDSVKQALQSGPLVTTLSVYADFMSYGSGVYKHVSGDFLGGHAVSIVGYDDTKRAFIIRNSWGTEWGENGFAYVSYDDESGVGDETYSFDIPSMNGAVSLAAPLDYNDSTSDMTVKAVSTFKTAGSIALTIFDSSNQPVWNQSCNPANCSVNADLTGLKDGRYNIEATAMDSHGQILGTSGLHLFYVANVTPELQLSFVGKGGLDLNQPLSGRPEFVISAKSSTAVPMNSIAFHYKGADGVDHTRTSNIVMDGMTMGWRTTTVSNGQYEIWMSGRLQTNHFNETVETPHQTITVAN